MYKNETSIDHRYRHRHESHHNHWLQLLRKFWSSIFNTPLQIPIRLFVLLFCTCCMTFTFEIFICGSYSYRIFSPLNSRITFLSRIPNIKFLTTWLKIATMLLAPYYFSFSAGNTHYPGFGYNFMIFFVLVNQQSIITNKLWKYL